MVVRFFFAALVVHDYIVCANCLILSITDACLDHPFPCCASLHHTDSLVLRHLEASGYEYTVSVFVPESIGTRQPVRAHPRTLFWP